MESPSPWRMLVRNPMVRVASPIVFGMAIGTTLRLPLGALAIALACSTLAMVLVFVRRTVHRRRWQRGVLFALWALTFGAFHATLRDPHSDPDDIGHTMDRRGPWSMRVIALNGASDKLLRADARVLGRWEDDRFVRATGKVMLALLRGDDGATVAVGDRILVNAIPASIDRIADPGGFDRKGWAASRGLTVEMFAPRKDWDRTGHSPAWSDAFLGTRARIADWMEESGMPARELAIVKALVLGLRDELEGDQREAFVRSGTIHVLAVSGTHVGFIYAMLLAVFRAFGEGRKARLLRGVLVLAALWGYAGLTGASPSVLRATIMFSLFTVAGMTAQKNDPLNSLFVACLVLLLWDPHMLVEIGFQLSFLAVLGIILFYKRIQELWSPDNWFLRRVWELCALSLAAQTFTTPLSVHLFQAFPTWFLPANLIVVTAAGLAVHGAVALILLHKVPFIGAGITWILTQLVRGVDLTTAFFSTLPGAYPPVRIGVPEMVLLYVAVFALLAGWSWRWRPAPRVGVLALSLLMLLTIARIRNGNARSTFVVYDDRHALNAAMVHGRHFCVLSEEDLAAEESWMRMKVERHRRAIGLDGPVPLDLRTLNAGTVSTMGNTIAGGGRWSTPRLNVLFITNDRDVPELPSKKRFDAVVISGLQWIDAAAFEGFVDRADVIVLAGDVAWGVRKFVLNACRDRAIPTHDVRDQGAFILEGDGDPSTQQ